MKFYITGEFLFEKKLEDITGKIMLKNRTA